MDLDAPLMRGRRVSRPADVSLGGQGSELRGVVSYPWKYIEAAGVEVLVLRRDTNLAFHGGSWVFPGGRVDPADFEAAGSEHVADASTISANLGVNPSLTITAQTERAMSLWPNKGEPDPRPPLGTGYERVEPVRPQAPAVPAGAPAALMW